MIEYVLLAQMAVISPPANIMKNDTPVYSWQQPTTPPRYQVPATGIYMSGSKPPPIPFEEIEIQ